MGESVFRVPHRGGKTQAVFMRLHALLATQWVRSLLLALCVLATILGWHMTARSIRNEARKDFDFRVEETKNAIRNRMQAYEQVLRGGQGLMNAVGKVDRATWKTYVESLHVPERYPGIQGIGYALHIAPKNLDRHVAQIRAEGFPAYVVRPPGPRDQYTSIIYLEPFFDARNQRAFGFDMFSEERRRRAMTQARDSGQTAISAKVKLVQETKTDVQAGLLMYLPVYRPGMPADTPEQRRAALMGYVYSPFRMKNLMNGILGGYLQEVDLEIFDGRTTEDGAHMYDSDLSHGALTGRNPLFATEEVVDMYGRPWTLRMQSLPAFESRLESRAPEAVLALGGAICALLFLVMRALTLTNAKAHALAEEMTAGYRHELDERQRAEQALTRREDDMRLLLQSMWEGVYGLDTEGRCTFCNPAALRLLGYARPEDLLGQNVHALIHHHRADGTLFDVSECRIFQSFQTATSAHVADEVFWRADGSSFPVEYWASPQLREGATVGGVVTFIDISERMAAEGLLRQAYAEMESNVERRTSELAAANREMNLVLGAVSAFLVGLDHEEQVRRWNCAAAQAFGVEYESAIGRRLDALGLAWDGEAVARGIAQCREHKSPVRINSLSYRRQSGSREGFLMLSVSPLISENGALEGFLLLGDDVTDIKFLETQLAQAQRLESIGQLAAGIAHEINTPAQYVGNNLSFIKGAVEDLLALCEKAREAASAATQCEVARPAAQELEALMLQHDMEYLSQEVPGALTQTLEGVERISSIVRSMKQFAHPGEGHRRGVDINAALENTLVVSRNEWKYVAEVETRFDASLPEVMGLPGELNQVFLNLVVNAAHAIADVVRDTPAKGRITLTTQAEGEHVRISIADTGTGIPAEARAHVFDPFFTTKPVGQGTGQGLAIAHDIIVNKHGGSLSFETEPGVGTTFVVLLPLGLDAG